MEYISLSAIGFGIVGLFVLIALMLRRVVSTNEVHIVQSARSTTSYGKDTKNGNSYYEWPSWIPFIGITKTVLPLNVFDLDIEDYEAYEIGRLPFVVDIKAFFRINDSNTAAMRVHSFEELKSQLDAIVKGAVRSILASSEIEKIMQGRSEFGDMFTAQVATQLPEWGVVAVKNIELMDIRDGSNSQVIRNIMEKKKSFIEMESRKEVALNKRQAEIAEIESKRDVEIERAASSQAVGLRAAQQAKEVGLADEATAQAIKEQESITKNKEMQVQRVETLQRAMITRDAAEIKAEQDKNVMIRNAEAEKSAASSKAEATKLLGEADAKAKELLLLADVAPQIELAEKIANSKEYQEYLVSIEKVKAMQAVGEAQAEALKEADIKIIANSGDIGSGVNSLADILSSKGGMSIAALMEGLASTEKGKALLSKVGVSTEETTKH